MSLLIRQARAADGEALRAILYETFSGTWAPHLTAAAAAAYRAEDRAGAYVARSGTEFWVAERNGVLAGLVHWRGDFVHALHVRPGQTRARIGVRLMDRAESAIAAAGFDAARLETDTFNTASRDFYAARGYREAGRYPDEEWRSGLTTILLVKRLVPGASGWSTIDRS